MENNTYNGWSNYATWRINLEYGLNYGGFEGYNADMLQEYVEESLELNCDNETALSYALSFVSDVNWYEIAASIYDGEIENLVYEFNNMKNYPIIEIHLGDYLEGMDGEYRVFNLEATPNGIESDNGLIVEWDTDFSLDQHLESMMDLIIESITEEVE